MSAAAATIAIAGAGRMGRGIALSFAYAGFPVTLIDSEERPADDFSELVASVGSELSAELAFLAEVGAVSKEQAGAIQKRVKVVPVY